jgi:hypothetical protein
MVLIMKSKNAIAKGLIAIMLLSAMMIVIPQGVYAATVFEDDFETGDYSKWAGTVNNTGSMMEMSEVGVFDGQYSAVSSMSGNLNTYAYVYQNLAPALQLYHREYIKVSALPPSGAETDLFGIMDQIAIGSHLGTLGIQNDGTNYRWKLKYSNNGAVLVSYSTQVELKENSWYYVEIMVKIGSGTGQVAVWIAEDLTVINESTPTINLVNLENGGKTIGAIFFGGYVTGATYPVNIYSDNVVVSDTWVGPMDFTSPSIGPITATSYSVGAPVIISSSITDDVGIDSVIPSWNNSGTWVNQTAIDAGGSTSLIATLSGTWNTNPGTVTSVIFYAKDTSNNWAKSSQTNFALNNYVVTLDANSTSPTQEDAISINIAVTKNGAPFTNYLANLTKDGSTFLNNQMTSFTDTEIYSTSHAYTVSSLYDNSVGERVPFTTNTLNVQWGKSTYNVTISANQNNVIIGTTVTINLNVIKNGLPFNSYVANVSKDGSPYLTNVSGSITDVYLNSGVHFYSITALIDTVTQEKITFTTNTATVNWIQGSVTPTPTVTPNPTINPTSTPPPSTTEPTSSPTISPTITPTQTSQPTESPLDTAIIIGLVIAVILTIIIISVILIRRRK